MEIQIRKAQAGWARYKPVVVIVAVVLVGGVAALTWYLAGQPSRGDAARDGAAPGTQAFDRRVEPWRPSTMARSDPEAMVLAGGALGDASKGAGAPKEKMAAGHSPEELSEYARAKVRGAERAVSREPVPIETPQEAGSSRQLERSSLGGSDRASLSSSGPAPLSSAVSAARSDAAQTAMGARASPAAGAGKPKRGSRFSTPITARMTSPSVAPGRPGAPTFKTGAPAQPSADQTGPGAEATSAARAGGAPAVAARMPGAAEQGGSQGGGAVGPGGTGSNPREAGVAPGTDCDHFQRGVEILGNVTERYYNPDPDPLNLHAHVLKVTRGDANATKEIAKARLKPGNDQTCRDVKSALDALDRAYSAEMKAIDEAIPVCTTFPASAEDAPACGHAAQTALALDDAIRGTGGTLPSFVAVAKTHPECTVLQFGNQAKLNADTEEAVFIRQQKSICQRDDRCAIVRVGQIRKAREEFGQVHDESLRSAIDSVKPLLFKQEGEATDAPMTEDNGAEGLLWHATTYDSYWGGHADDPAYLIFVATGKVAAAFRALSHVSCPGQ